MVPLYLLRDGDGGGWQWVVPGLTKDVKERIKIRNSAIEIPINSVCF